MDIGLNLLSEVVVHDKYAQKISQTNRKETWEELVTRNKNMHLNKFKDHPRVQDIKTFIEQAYSFVYEKKVLPSMRSLQFGGKAISKNNVKMYNCAYLPISDIQAFSELMYCLLCGTGVGFSVQKHHVNNLPARGFDKQPTLSYVIKDSIEGWCDAVYTYLTYFFEGGRVEFDFSKIRPKGSIISSGGYAPGPEPLMKSFNNIQKILDSVKRGEKLSSLQVHDIICYMSDAVLAGGVRRSALISLFSVDDEEMLFCKKPGFYKENSQRCRANNSVVLHRDFYDDKNEFSKLMKTIFKNNTGEPGIFWTSDYEILTNPCAEIALYPYQFCNLVEINLSSVKNQEELIHVCHAASVIATLQASYTDFTYLSNRWKKQTEKEALLGIGATGICGCDLDNLDFEDAAKHIKYVNSLLARVIGINEAARTTTVKPSGSTSCVVGSSSGIHSWYAPYYIRRVSLNKDKPLYKYLVEAIPDLVEDSIFENKKDIEAVISIPCKAPENAITRDSETITDAFMRAIKFNREWIKAGHNTGPNTHNTSITIHYKPEEEEKVLNLMWEYRDSYNGVSLFPHLNKVYPQAPFEEISEAEYLAMCQYLSDNPVNLLEVDESVSQSEVEHEHLINNMACVGGNCELV